MGTTLHIRTYPEEIVKPKYFKYLDYERVPYENEFEAKHMPEGFFDVCRKYGTEYDDFYNDEYFHCFAIPFLNMVDFISDNKVPDAFNKIFEDMCINKEDVMVIWCH